MSRQSISHPPLLGCVADDMTGATDLSNNLVGAGMRVIQFLKIPTADEIGSITADAIVVALKTRSIDPRDAADQSVEAIKRGMHVVNDHCAFQPASASSIFVLMK